MEKSTQVPRETGSRPRSGLAPWVVLLVALSVTALGTVFVQRVVNERDRMRFEDLAAARVRDLEQRVQSYLDALHAVAALVALKPDLSGGDFRYFVERLEAPKSYPDIQGIGWAPRVDVTDDAMFELHVRNAGNPTFQIWPERTNGSYHPVLFQEPAPHAGRYGFDLGSDAGRAAAMELARESGDAVVSGKVTLDDYSPGNEGFVVFMPVYAGSEVPATVPDRIARLRGFVYTPFRAKSFFQTTLEGRKGLVAISVYDGTERVPARLYYSDERASPDTPLFESERSIDVAGRTWLIEFASTPAFAHRSQSYLMPLVLLGGLLLSLLLTGITWSETRARAAAERASAELARSREALRLANTTKDEFLAMLGHELRNPIGALANSVRVMRMTRPDDPALQRSLDVAARQVRQQTRLVDDLLDVSRMSTGKIRLQKQRLDLNDLVRSVVVDALPRAEEQMLTVQFHPSQSSLTVDADPVRLAQIVMNLLNNAVKYTPSGGQIDVAVEHDGSHELPAAIRVRDTGTGIEPEALSRIFDLFAQAESTKDRAQGGLGIGLTLARQLVELHSGRIEARSQGRGKGSEFVIRLPTVSGPPQPVEYEDSRVSVRVGLDERTRDRLTILVVEDNADAREMLAELLALLGHRVLTATDGRAGVEEALRHRPDAALIDLGLPVMSGYEVARALREDPNTQGMFLVALTGYGQPEDRRHALEAGFDEHLVKPLDVARLNALLDGGSMDTRARATR